MFGYTVPVPHIPFSLDSVWQTKIDQAAATTCRACSKCLRSGEFDRQCTDGVPGQIDPQLAGRGGVCLTIPRVEERAHS